MQRRVHSFTFVIQLFLGLPRQHPSSAEPWRTVLENIRKKSPTDEHGGVVVMESFFIIFSRKTLNSRFTMGQAWRMPTVVQKRSHNWMFIRTEIREPLDSTSMVRARPSFMLNSAPQAKTPLARPCQKSFLKSMKLWKSSIPCCRCFSIRMRLLKICLCSCLV